MFSKFVRRSHMYLALFLTPSILMYALSTLAMTHRAAFRQTFYTAPSPASNCIVFPSMAATD